MHQAPPLARIKHTAITQQQQVNIQIFSGVFLGADGTHISVFRTNLRDPHLARDIYFLRRAQNHVWRHASNRVTNKNNGLSMGEIFWVFLYWLDCACRSLLNHWAGSKVVRLLVRENSCPYSRLIHSNEHKTGFTLELIFPYSTSPVIMTRKLWARLDPQQLLK